MRHLRVWLAFGTSCLMLGIGGCDRSAQDAADEGHGSAHADEAAGGRDAAQGEHEPEHGGDVIVLTREQLESAGVLIEPLSGGVVSSHISLPSEVSLNQDTLLHATPRVAGIVTEVHGYLGSFVEEGDELAVLESPKLGEAKIAYLQALQARSLADAELDRQRTISANTATLLEILRAEPSPEALNEQASGLRIGANKGRLLSAYARVAASRANVGRERELHTKGLTTEASLLAAQESFNSSLADYFAAFEEIDFSYRISLQAAEQSALIAASAVDNAERRLHLLGLSDEQIEGIPDEADTDVARYVLTAAAGGRIVSKHITPGEMVGPDESVYTIADLDTVWLNVSVYARYADQISQGQRVVVHAEGRTTSGVVDYVSDIMDEGSRTVPARVVLDNADRAWKPGSFATVRVDTGQVRAERVVPIDAIQTFEGREVVFVQDDDGIEPVPVRLGRRNDVSVEILGDDIPLGTPVVVRNSFLMKAELGKSAAGHEH